jgi:hypothetical protein
MIAYYTYISKLAIFLDVCRWWSLEHWTDLDQQKY